MIRRDGLGLRACAPSGRCGAGDGKLRFSRYHVDVIVKIINIYDCAGRIDYLVRRMVKDIVGEVLATLRTRQRSHQTVNK